MSDLGPDVFHLCHKELTFGTGGYQVRKLNPLHYHLKDIKCLQNLSLYIPQNSSAHILIIFL